MTCLSNAISEISARSHLTLLQKMGTRFTCSACNSRKAVLPCGPQSDSASCGSGQEHQGPVTFLREVLATKPALMVATVRDAPHCWHRRNMMRVALSLSNRVSGLLQLLHSTYLQAYMIIEAH